MMLRFRFSKIKRSNGANEGSGNCGFVITILFLVLLNDAVHGLPVNDDEAKVQWITDELSSPEDDFTDGADQSDDSFYAELTNLLNQLKFYENDERMQADQPQSAAVSDQPPSNSTLVDENRKRLNFDRANQLLYIMQKVENYTRDKLPTSPSPSPSLPDNIIRLLSSCPMPLNQVQTGNVASKTEVLQPSCSIPEHSVEDDRPGNNDLSIYFSFGNLSSNEPVINVSAMTLRLYKLPPKPKESGSQERNAGTMASKSSENVATTSSPNSKQENKKINVTLYYRKQISKKKVEKVKVDSRILNANDESVTEWNILQSPETMQKMDGFTFTVGARDELGHHLPAQQFFSVVDCSKPVDVPKTIPSVFLECLTKQKNSLSEENKKYIDRLIRLPRLEILYRKAKKSSSKKHINGLRVETLFNNSTVNTKSRRRETTKTTTKEPSSLSRNLSTKSSNK